VAGGSELPAPCHLPNQICRGKRRRANLHEFPPVGIIKGCVREHQLDEADDDRKVIAEEVNRFRVERDGAGGRHICTQFAATVIICVQTRMRVSVLSRHRVRQILTKRRESAASC
jgi:hypothetical protein